MPNFQHPTYELDQIIGEGGMSTVYLAEHKTMRRPVAIKFLRQELMTNDNIRKRFISEGRNMFAMDHPNIVRVLDLIDTSEYVAIVMEYVPGITLKGYIERFGKIEDNDLQSFFRQMLRAVGYIHSQGYIHRDIKPSNFKVTPEGTIKLFDFGIAKSLKPENQEHTVTGTSQIMGTPLYMSPEQVKETHAVTHATDIYSLGVVLWQMVTGKRPYGDSLATYELQTKIVNEPLATTGTKWDSIIQRASVKDPQQRFASCEEMQSAVKKVEEVDYTATRIESPEEKKGASKAQKSTSTPHVENQVKGTPSASGAIPEAGRRRSSGFWKIILWTGFGSMLMIGGIIAANGGSWDSVFSFMDDWGSTKEDVHPIIEKIESNMVFVEGGTFTMGCTSEQGEDCYDDERPAHRVTVSDYAIGRYEVTQKEWREVMGSNPSYFTNCDNCPVERVSWEDIQQFLWKLNARTGKTYRLPTEAEWEYAARGGSSSRGYKYAGSEDVNEVAWYNYNSERKTHRVGQKQANELGLYDMGGNVYEWCQDWYGEYTAGAQVNPKGALRASDRVRRGGSWIGGARLCRTSLRSYDAPSFHFRDLGFRLAL